MKGIKVEVDTNNDGRIATEEIQDYLSDKNDRQVMDVNRGQYPLLVGIIDIIMSINNIYFIRYANSSL
jgi:hypothetical protein